jgi:NADH-quinone oxidoreductase subunit N
MAAASMLLGAAAAFVQRDLKRFLGWSAVSQTGFVLVPVASGASELHGSILYLAAYAAASLGVFAVVAAMAHDGREDPDMERLRGLARRRPWIAAGLALCLLSLAGLPLTGGFPAKVYVFLAAIDGGRGWLAAVAVVAALAGAAYALKPVALLFAQPGEGVPIEVGPAGRTVLAAAVIVVLALGVVPGPFAGLCRVAVAGLGR